MAFAAISNTNRERAVPHSQDAYFPRVSSPHQGYFEDCQLRSETLKVPSTFCEHSPDTIPVGFPKFINGPAAWTGTDFEKIPFEERSNALNLDTAQIRELEQACEYFEGVF